MVNMRNNTCSHGACTTLATFSVKGKKTALVCETNAAGGMMDIVNKLLSHDSCTIRVTCGVGGRNTAW